MRFIRHALFLTAMSPLFAGGFYLNVTSAPASSDKLIASLTGCHNAEFGKLTATAEGIVNGQRRTIQLEVTPLKQPGQFEIKRQWPAEGKWIVWVKGVHPEFNLPTEALVTVHGVTIDRSAIVQTGAQRRIETAQLEAMLR